MNKKYGKYKKGLKQIRKLEKLKAKASDQPADKKKEVSK